MTGTGGALHEAPWPRADLLVSLVAIVAALALSLLWSGVGRRSVDPASAALVSYLVFWIPLLAAAVLVRSRGWNPDHPITWRLTALDLLWGLGAGLLLRAVAASIEFIIRGTVVAPSIGPSVGATPALTLSILAVGVLAPIVLAPAVEELFFRGTLLTALERPGKGTTSAIVAVALSALVFAIPHVVGSSNSRDALVGLTGAAILGLGAGALAVTTRRIGAPIVAHITFNAALLILLVV